MMTEMLEFGISIDWSKAPEGAEYARTDGVLIQWVKDSNGSKYLTIVNNVDDSSLNAKDWIVWNAAHPMDLTRAGFQRKPKRRGGLQKGQSGNLNGRPVGAKGKKTLIREALGVVGNLTSANTALVDLLFSDNPEQAHWALDLIRNQMLK